jgi:glycosyltransferase involved in cell wall biosynthesis
VLRIGLLSAAFPPDLDGIGDYTYWLAREVARMGIGLSVWTSWGRQRLAAQGVEIIPFFDPNRPSTISKLPDLLVKERAVDWLVIQYNPFGFGRRGYCPWLVDLIGNLKQKSVCRVAVMYHETQLPPRPWKFWVMRQWQNRQLRSSSRLADVIFIATQLWEKEIHEVSPGVVCHHLPVGSNLPRSKILKQAARDALALSRDTLVLGIFGFKHFSRLPDWIGATVHRVADLVNKVAVLYLGRDGDFFRQYCAGIPFIDSGVLAGEQAADRLKAMDLLLSPFSDGVSTRRGSVLAALHQGVAVASTWSRQTDAVFHAKRLKDLILTPCGDSRAFIKGVEGWIASGWKEREGPSEELELFYETHFSWPVIARKMIQVIQESSSINGGSS